MAVRIGNIQVLQNLLRDGAKAAAEDTSVSSLLNALVLYYCCLCCLLHTFAAATATTAAGLTCTDAGICFAVHTHPFLPRAAQIHACMTRRGTKCCRSACSHQQHHVPLLVLHVAISLTCCQTLQLLAGNHSPISSCRQGI